jgi:hypothetical protein
MWEYNENTLKLDAVVESLGLDFVSYISADINYVGKIENFRGVHVIRDPRDIVTSAYFSHLHSHSTEHWPELAEFRKVLQKLPKDEGFLENMKFTEVLRIDGWDVNLFSTLNEWDYSLSNVLEVKFEELIKNPYQVFLKIFDFWGISEHSSVTAKSLLKNYLRHKYSNAPRIKTILGTAYKIPAWWLLYFIYDYRFTKLAGGRSVGEENAKSHYRKGGAGDWVNHFNEQHKKYFKENYNDLLVKLGYEKDDNW